MVAKVRTNRVFDGRMYGKTRPNSCTIDVRKSLDFELYLGFNDIDCDVRQVKPGKFATDVIIQVNTNISPLLKLNVFGKIKISLYV